MAFNKQTRGQGAEPGFPRLLADRLCLDFVNTLDAPLTGHPEEFLHRYDDLVRWGRHSRILSDEAVARLRELADGDPGKAEQSLRRAIDLRGAMSRIFRAIAGQIPPSRKDLTVLQRAHVDALAESTLTVGPDGGAWIWPEDHADLALPLWLIVDSAIQTLTDDDHSRIRVCPGANDCGGLFYDTSRNGSRRWCSMEGCGSRVKMRHHYARQRAAGADPAE